MLTEGGIRELLKRKQIRLRPLEFVRNPLQKGGLAYTVSWQGKQAFQFIAAIKTRATSQVLAAAALQAKSLAFDAGGSFPLVIVPYLSPVNLDEVEGLGISAVDLCGNGILQGPPHWLVVRSGSPNRFRGSEPLRGVYRRSASLVARAFMIKPTFARVSDVHHFIAARGGGVALATVSKALSGLEEDLVIARQAGGLRLLQPDKLLSKLRDDYRPPSISTRLVVNSKQSEAELHRRLRRAIEIVGGRMVMTGISSASRQTVVADEPITSFYCEASPEDIAKAASIDPSSPRHFADLELLQTHDEWVYFDARDDAGRTLASPLQTWLELATGDKRSQEVADELRLRLIRDAGARPDGDTSHG